MRRSVSNKVSDERGTRGFAGRLVELLDHRSVGLLLDPDPRIRKIEKSQAGDVSRLHTTCIQFCCRNGDGTDGSLCQCISRPPEIRGWH